MSDGHHWSAKALAYDWNAISDELTAMHTGVRVTVEPHRHEDAWLVRAQLDQRDVPLSQFRSDLSVHHALVETQRFTRAEMLERASNAAAELAGRVREECRAAIRRLRGEGSR